jgi:hypothetical protein
MAAKEKAAAPCQVKAAEITKLKPNNTPPNPLSGWFDLSASVKPSRANRQPKRSWKRGRK